MTYHANSIQYTHSIMEQPGGAGGDGPDQIVVILVLPEEIKIVGFVGNFCEYIPKLAGAGGKFGYAFDQHFFSSMASFRAISGKGALSQLLAKSKLFVLTVSLDTIMLLVYKIASKSAY